MHGLYILRTFVLHYLAMWVCQMYLKLAGMGQVKGDYILEICSLDIYHMFGGYIL